MAYKIVATSTEPEVKPVDVFEAEEKSLCQARLFEYFKSADIPQKKANQPIASYDGKTLVIVIAPILNNYTLTYSSEEIKP